MLQLDVFILIILGSRMNKIFSFCNVAAIALTLIACNGSNTSSSPTSPDQKENDVSSSSSNRNLSATSSATNSGNGSADLNAPAQEVVQENESSRLPSMYGECRSPVYWNPADTGAILINSNSTGTECDSLDIVRPETWKYAFKYTKNDGQDTVFGYHSYLVNENCLVQRISTTFTATSRSQIKKYGSSLLDPSYTTLCKDDECFTTMNIVNSFKEIQEACLIIAEKDDIQMFRNFDEVAVDTAIYITQKEYDCKYKYLCDE